ncbi:MAG: N-acetylglucosamine-6-phosphate deacetylase [Clostridiales bacterium]|nr:N-acetylglucosamine-6-phosphate deacetylase [Clostridiales bacterium]
MDKIRGIIYTERFIFEPGIITIDGDRISSVEKCDMANLTTEESQRYLLPGLVDIHLHGAVGYDFCDADKEAIEAINSYEISCGVTSFCLATMTLPMERLKEICTAARYFQTEGMRGIYLEGPFIAEKRKGAQKSEFIRTPDIELIESLQELSGGLVKIVTIAPEIEGALACIENNKDNKLGARFSLAHTDADYETALRAIDAGAAHITHMYNAMPPFLHRAPGVIGAAAEREETEIELICDGVHIHSAVVRSTFKLFGDERIILISDSMMAAGMKDGLYTLGGQEVLVKNKKAVLKDGTIAGSASNLYDCMLMAVSMGISKEVAIKAATYNPTRSIGIDREYGTLEAGKIADILITDLDLGLCGVIKSGRRIAP